MDDGDNGGQVARVQKRATLGKILGIIKSEGLPSNHIGAIISSVISQSLVEGDAFDMAWLEIQAEFDNQM
ncbi:unnamed protein product [Ectocarpus sp. 6 AP-2014]